MVGIAFMNWKHCLRKVCLDFFNHREHRDHRGGLYLKGGQELPWRMKAQGKKIP